MPAKLTKEVIKKFISERHRSGGKLSSDYMRRNHGTEYYAGMRLFGNWQKAVEASGVDYIGEVKTKPNSTRVIWRFDNILGEIKFLEYLATNLSDAYIKLHFRPLYSAARREFGSWKLAVEAAGFDYSTVSWPMTPAQAPRKRRHYFWTKETIKEEILRRQSEKLSLSGNVVSVEDRGLYKAAIRVFGTEGWDKALAYVGVTLEVSIKTSRRDWSPEKVIAGILELHHKGEPLYQEYMRLHHGPLFAAGRDLFKGWRKAVRAAGIEYRTVRFTEKPYGWWSPRRILARVRLLEKRGTRLSYKTMLRTNPGMVTAGRKHFGSWSETVEAAEISYRQHCRYWSTKAWLRRLRGGDIASMRERVETNAAIRRKAHSRRKKSTG